MYGISFVFVVRWMQPLLVLLLLLLQSLQLILMFMLALTAHEQHLAKGVQIVLERKRRKKESSSPKEAPQVHHCVCVCVWRTGDEANYLHCWRYVLCWC